MSAIVSMSGGLDSTVVLAKAMISENSCIGVSFFYGSKHSKYELSAASAIASTYRIPHTTINMVRVFAGFRSDLLLSGGDIPEGHYQAESMRSTVVPNRNAIFISALVGLADSVGIDRVYLGIHAGDHAIYPDCRPSFFRAIREAAEEATEGRVSLVAPFLNVDKMEIIRQGLSMGCPLNLTRTCYKDQELACGKCGSCRERLESFERLGVKDPLTYERSE